MLARTSLLRAGICPDERADNWVLVIAANCSGDKLLRAAVLSDTTWDEFKVAICAEVKPSN